MLIRFLVRGETTILEHMLQDNMLNDYYINALGFHQYTKYLARIVGQLAHRYPDMDILEIGTTTTFSINSKSNIL